MASRELLAQCADAVVCTSNGTHIPVSKYTCMASCPLLRELMDATTLEKTADGKVIIPIPGTDSSCLQLTLEIIHGVRLVPSLSLAEVLSVLSGTSFLGCIAMEDALMDRLWSLMSCASITLVREHAGTLLRSPNHGVKMLSLLIRLMPLWKDFRTFLEADYVAMDAELAVFMGSQLVKFFPPATVLCALVDLLPRASLTQSTLLKLVGLPGSGVYFHPRETTAMISMMLNYFGAKRWDPSVEACFRTLMDASRRYEAVPHAASVINGSVFMYDGAPTSSAYLAIDRRLTTTKTVRVCPWLRVVINPGTGHIQLWLRPYKMDEMSRVARNIQLRLTAGHSAEMDNVDVWYEWHNVSVTPSTVLTVASVNRSTGSHSAFHEAVRSSSLKSLRLDVFYGALSALDNPLDV